MPGAGGLSEAGRVAALDLDLVVVARRLLHRAVPGLPHGLLQRNPTAGRLGEIARAQPMCRKGTGIQPRLGAALLQNGVDALRVERGAAEVAPAGDLPER